MNRAPFLGYAIAAGVALADQATKFAVASSFGYGEILPLTPFFNMVHVGNKGASFGLLAGAGGWQRYFFIALALAISAWLVVLIWQKRLQTLPALAYSLVLGGALGNVASRILTEHVVDFLDFHWRGWHWPAFNLADIAICLGVAGIVATEILLSPAKKPAA